MKFVLSGLLFLVGLHTSKARLSIRALSSRTLNEARDGIDLMIPSNACGRNAAQWEAACAPAFEVADIKHPRSTVAADWRRLGFESAQKVGFLTREVDIGTFGEYIQAGAVTARSLLGFTGTKQDVKKGGGYYVYTRGVPDACTLQVTAAGGKGKGGGKGGGGSVGSASPIMLIFGPELLARPDMFAWSLDGAGCPPWDLCATRAENKPRLTDEQCKVRYPKLVKKVREHCGAQFGVNHERNADQGMALDTFEKGINSCYRAGYNTGAEMGFFGSIPWKYVKAIVVKKSQAGLNQFLTKVQENLDRRDLDAPKKADWLEVKQRIIAYKEGPVKGIAALIGQENLCACTVDAEAPAERVEDPAEEVEPAADAF